jgi:topoisomerase-4 subunit A
LIIEREAAKALDETELLPTEPLTIVVSESGWVRAAKGHDVDPEALNYRTGDRYLTSTKARSNQQIIFLDSTGRSFSLAAHTLPSARSQGEPLSGRLQLASDAKIVKVLAGPMDAPILFANSAGYGLITTLENLLAKNKAGKAVFNLPDGAEMLPPIWIENEQERLAVTTGDGRLLVFKIEEVPTLNKGKGVRLINIPQAQFTAQQEWLHSLCVIPEDASLTIHAGKRYLSLKPTDIEHYTGLRGKRGNKLPRGLQKVSGIEVQPKES